MPAFTTALSFFDGYRSEIVPANLVQAQRDYFGAHTFLVLPGKENERFVSGENIRASSYCLFPLWTGNQRADCRSLSRRQLDRAWWKCLSWKLCRVEQFCHGGHADLDMWMYGKVKESSVERNKGLWYRDSLSRAERVRQRALAGLAPK